MKNFSLLYAFAATVTSCLLFNTNAFAADANLKINLSGNELKNTYFLCLKDGCVNLAAATKGKTFPLTPGKLDQVFVLNTENLRMHKQILPASCQGQINAKQTLQVTGKLTTTRDGEPDIHNLSCRVVG